MSNDFWLANTKIYTLRCQNLAAKGHSFLHIWLESFGWCNKCLEVQDPGLSFCFSRKVLCQTGDATYSKAREYKSSTKRPKYCGWRSRQLNWQNPPPGNTFTLKPWLHRGSCTKIDSEQHCSHTHRLRHCSNTLDCCYLILVVADIRRFQSGWRCVDIISPSRKHLKQNWDLISIFSHHHDISLSLPCGKGNLWIQMYSVSTARQRSHSRSKKIKENGHPFAKYRGKKQSNHFFIEKQVTQMPPTL